MSSENINIEYKGHSIIRARGMIPTDSFDNLDNKIRGVIPGIFLYLKKNDANLITAITRLPYELSAQDAAKGLVHPERADINKIYVVSNIDSIAKTYEDAQSGLSSAIQELHFEYANMKPGGIFINKIAMKSVLDELVRLDELILTNFSSN